MKATSRSLRATAFIAGTAMLVGLGAGAAFGETSYGEEGVDIGVVISPAASGALAMTVAGTSATLTESGSTGTVRQFVGTLPNVTVTDTRDVADIPTDAFWYVVGSASNFVGDAAQPDIPAANLGWVPALVDGGPSGLVAEGDPVYSALDTAEAPDNVGLVDQELLAMALDSALVNPDGQWTANADLVLLTSAGVAPGTYHSTLTLSLFE